MRSTLLSALMNLIFTWPLIADGANSTGQKLDAREKEIRALGVSEEKIRGTVEKSQKKNAGKTTIFYGEKNQEIIELADALNRLFSLQLILEKSNRYDLVYHSLINNVNYKSIPKKLHNEYKKILKLCQVGELKMGEIGIAEKYFKSNNKILYGKAATAGISQLLQSDITGAIITGFDTLEQKNILAEDQELKLNKIYTDLKYQLRENMQDLRILSDTISKKYKIPKGYILYPEDLEKLSGLAAKSKDERFGQLSLMGKQYPRFTLIDLYKLHMIVNEGVSWPKNSSWIQVEEKIRTNYNRSYPVDPSITGFYSLVTTEYLRGANKSSLGDIKQFSANAENLNVANSYIALLAWCSAQDKKKIISDKSFQDWRQLEREGGHHNDQYRIDHALSLLNHAAKSDNLKNLDYFKEALVRLGNTGLDKKEIHKHLIELNQGKLFTPDKRKIIDLVSRVKISAQLEIKPSLKGISGRLTINNESYWSLEGITVIGMAEKQYQKKSDFLGRAVIMDANGVFAKPIQSWLEQAKKEKDFGKLGSGESFRFTPINSALTAINEIWSKSGVVYIPKTNEFFTSPTLTINHLGSGKKTTADFMPMGGPSGADVLLLKCNSLQFLAVKLDLREKSTFKKKWEMESQVFLPEWN